MTKKYVLEKSSVIKCRPDQIFKVLKDLKNWNKWTKSIEDISYVDNDAFVVGAKVKISQPKLPPAVWTIADISENESFSMEKKSLGLKVTANHILKGSADGTIFINQIIYEGFLARFFYNISSRLTTEYVNMENDGLKEICEKTS